MPHHPLKTASAEQPSAETGAATAPAPPTSASARADQAIVARALRKMATRQDLSRREREALKRYEKEQEEKKRWQYYGTIPQKHWVRMSGRQTKVLNEQAQRHRIPFGGPVIDLTKVVPALHQFLAENKYKLAADDDPLMQGGGSPALEDYRKERAALARLDRLEREGELIPRREAREALARMAALIRGAGDTLQRQFGSQAAEILHEALNDSQRLLDQIFGGTDAGSSRETSNTD